MKKKYVYLLCFEEPYEHAHHYLGLTSDPWFRIRMHHGGKSRAKLITAIHEAGIRFKIVRMWVDDGELEQWLKSQKCSPRFCPRCGGEKPRQAGHAEEVPYEEVRRLVDFEPVLLNSPN